jgi:hypothetical protein
VTRLGGPCEESAEAGSEVGDVAALRGFAEQGEGLACVEVAERILSRGLRPTDEVEVGACVAGDLEEEGAGDETVARRKDNGLRRCRGKRHGAEVFGTPVIGEADGACV